MPSLTGDAPAAAQATALPDRRELALVSVERTRMPMVICRAGEKDSPIVLANSAFLELTGYDAEEVLGRDCRFLQGPETAPEPLAQIREGLRTDQHFIAVELLNYRKNGSTFWNRLAISPVHDETGRVTYYFASQLDVSVQRRAQKLEAVERALLMEVDHRAMNALALVQSILSLTKASSVKEFSASVQLRVGAIALVHRLLASTSWMGIDLRKLLSEVTSDSVQYSSPGDFFLPPRIAQPLGIVFHELVSNARQHGSLRAPAGAVSVLPQLRQDVIGIRWVEHGLDCSAWGPRTGLGLPLIRTIVERQLGGSVDIDAAATGLNVNLQIPLTGPELRGIN